ncbi:hypothetical protein BSM4216_1832 [Bacillus smithii]|jgi:hypothetical protein|nr:hypothetical protein BSM4216_1832 [Bacillus smithii]
MINLITGNDKKAILPVIERFLSFIQKIYQFFYDTDAINDFKFFNQMVVNSAP